RRQPFWTVRAFWERVAPRSGARCVGGHGYCTNGTGQEGANIRCHQRPLKNTVRAVELDGLLSFSAKLCNYVAVIGHSLSHGTKLL
ncbi:unnamed protein product, partial [Staurois parvus]